MNHPEGYLEPENDGTFSYIYQYKDHLGNIRLSYADANNDSSISVSEILEEKNYYPFGLEHKGYNNTITGREHNYGYNGKEEQNELGLNWNDYGWRNYDPSIGRWMNIDIQSEAYYPITPYQYVLNNPVVNIDFEGQWTVTRHYNMTYNALSAAGIGKKQADLLAHYSSVYADNPGKHLTLNNYAHPTDMHHYRDNIDYSGTANSQVTEFRGTLVSGRNYNIWHSMRSVWEEENETISASEATARGMGFGWAKIFESAESGTLNNLKENSSGIQAFGQGLHALQDAYAHYGRSDVGASHVFNDRYGDTSKAESISKSAVNVHNLLSGNWDAFGGSEDIKIDTTGMRQNQIKKVLSAIQDYLSQNKEEEEN